MAVYNEILVGRFNRFLQKLLSMKGPAAMNMLAPELQAQIAFESGVENRFLEQWDTYSQGGVLGATATFVGQFKLRNPTGSNVILIVEGLYVGLGISGSFTLSNGPTTTDLSGVGLALAGYDSRQQRNSVGLISSSTNTATVTPLGNSNLRWAGTVQNFISVITDSHQEIPILPGQGIICGCDQVNAQFIFGVRWRERFLEDSERQ